MLRAALQSNLDEEFVALSEFWSPRVVAVANGQHVKVAKVKGEFVWHAHAGEDEFFLVRRGTLTIRYRDQAARHRVHGEVAGRFARRRDPQGGEARGRAHGPDGHARPRPDRPRHHGQRRAERAGRLRRAGAAGQIACAAVASAPTGTMGACAAVAQWIEYWPPKPRVVGSIPASRTRVPALIGLTSHGRHASAAVRSEPHPETAMKKPTLILSIVAAGAPARSACLRADQGRSRPRAIQGRPEHAFHQGREGRGAQGAAGQHKKVAKGTLSR